MIDHDRLDEILRHWAQSMRSGALPEFHIRAESAGKGYTHYDTEGGYLWADRFAIINCDAVIRGLQPLDRAIIEAKYTNTNWPIVDNPIEQLEIARTAVRIGLENRGVS